MTELYIVLIAAVVVLVLYRQVRGQFVRPSSTALRIPLILTALSAWSLLSQLPALTGTAVVLAAVDLLLTLALGAARGSAYRLELRDGFLYQRGGLPMLALWVLTIGVRVGAGFVGASLGAGPLLNASTTLMIGLSLLVQAAVFSRRVTADGRPVRPAPERGRRAERATLSR